MYLLSFLMDQTGSRMSFKVDTTTVAEAALKYYKGLSIKAEPGPEPDELIVRIS